MKKLLVLFFAVIAVLAQVLHGVEPKQWELRDLDDFLKGKFDGISVSFDGILSLSPKEDKIEGPAEEFYLSFLMTSEGTAFLGTGHGGKIYRIAKNGEIELYFRVPEMDVYCLAQDKGGNLYAGTSPDGKIYKITAKDQGNVFFNPQEKYIWDLLFTENDSLLAAVGERGGIYEINSSGEGDLILKAEENHILCLNIDKNGDLIAGSGGKGHLYRISKTKKAFILFESPYEEIKSIALDEEGNIFAAGGGVLTRPKAEKIPSVLTDIDENLTITVTPGSKDTKDISEKAKEQPSALYKVSPDGIAKKLWDSREDLIYTLFWDGSEKKIIFGTGDKGRIFSIDREGKTSLLLQKDSEQVYLLAPYNAKIYVLSNNPSSLNILYSEQRFNGEYISQVLDTKSLSSWGRITWEADVPSGTVLQFQSRSGNSNEPNKTWSDWSPPYQKSQGEQILSPKARYIQLKGIFKTQSGKVSPSLQRVCLFYVQTNVAPTITTLELLSANEVFLKPPEQQEIIWGLETDASEQSNQKGKLNTYIVPKKVQRKGYQTIMWDATDENGDSLLFSVYIKGEKERDWRLLKEKWIEEILTFDTQSFPDGIYFVKVEASDIPSNPLGTELKSYKTSRSFVIDSSLPVISNFKAVRTGSKLTLTFTAEDTFSYIKEAKYLIRPDEWRSIFPGDGICDSKQEVFNVTLALPLKFDNLITVKVEDSHGNVGVYRATF